MKVIANVLVDTRPRYAEWVNGGTQAWVSSEVGGTVAVIDAESYKILHKIDFPIPGVRREFVEPIGIRISKDGNIAFIALGPANRVAVVDTKTYEVLRYVVVGQRPWHMELDPDGSKLYVANGLTNDVTVIDVAALKPIVSATVGRLPWGIVIKP
jgi:YVTN family beta-propeller protein